MATDANSTIRNLIEICRDGEKGFRESAEHLKDNELRSYFLEQSNERGNFASELERQAVALGIDTKGAEGTTAATLHRAWLDLKANLGGGDSAVLSSAEAGEDAAKKAYKEALETDLPVGLRDVIQSQASAVFAAHDHVKLLRDRFKKAA